MLKRIDAIINRRNLWAALTHPAWADKLGIIGCTLAPASYLSVLFEKAALGQGLIVGTLGFAMIYVSVLKTVIEQREDTPARSDQCNSAPE